MESVIQGNPNVFSRIEGDEWRRQMRFRTSDAWQSQWQDENTVDPVFSVGGHPNELKVIHHGRNG